jgi:uncharacterized membrane-anchored protein
MAEHTGRQRAAWLTEPGRLRVPRITAYFWVIKGLSTALGESTSDYLVHAINPVIAVLLGFAGFLAALSLQFSRGRYVAWSYWLAVVMVGVFGTMAADVMHVVVGLPYVASSVLYAALLAAVFIAWWRTESSLSIHAIATARREAFYWAAVVATFAMGTALGDMTAYTLHLGYFRSLALYAALMAVPATGYLWLRWNGVFAFWFAYVITRPLGASFADGFGKPRSFGGLGFGDGHVSAVLAAAIVVLVAVLAASRVDVQRQSTGTAVGAGPPPADPPGRATGPPPTGRERPAGSRISPAAGQRRGQTHA